MQPSKSPADIIGQVESQTPAAQLGWSTVPLPSRGVLYDGRMPGGLVQVRKMMSGEMARLHSQGGMSLEKIEAVVNACTKLPDGFDPKDLLLVDSFFMMLAVRTKTYGPKYRYTYRCQQCGSQERAVVDIVEDLEEKPADENLTEPIEVKLVDANCRVAGRFMRLSDQDLIGKHVRRTKMATVDSSDPSYQYRLALSLVWRDDEPFTDLLRKQDFIRSLTAADCLRYERALQEKEPGIDIRVFPECAACNASNELGLPFDAEFFRPTTL